MKSGYLIEVNKGNKNEKHAIDNDNIVRKHYNVPQREYDYFKIKNL